MLVTAKDFDLIPYNIPNLEENDTFLPFVQQTEDKYLEELFGSFFYDLFKEAVELLPAEFELETSYGIGDQVVYGNNIWEALTVIPINNEEVPTEGANWDIIEENNMWLLLINGDKYRLNKKQYRFKGLKQAVIALVYGQWLEKWTYDTGTDFAVVTAETDNSEVISPGTRIVNSFNEYCEIAWDSIYYITKAVPTNFDPLFVGDEDWDSAYVYMCDNAELPAKINVFDL